MKHSTLLMGMVAAAFLFASCAKEAIDEAAPGETVENGGGGEYVYLSARVELPSGDSFGTRSATDDDPDSPSDANPDTEVGKDYENNVSTCLLVIADADNNFIAVSAVNGIKMNEAHSGFATTAKFERSQLKDLYAIDQETGNGPLKSEYSGKNFHLFVFCNPSELLTNKIAKISSGKSEASTLADLTGYVDENPMQPGVTPTTSNNIWAPDRFMMSNANIKSIQLPGTENMWDEHTDGSNPFDLSGTNTYEKYEAIDNQGAVRVERLAARFDYRDASGDKDENGVGNNTYKVLGSMDSEGGSDGMKYNFVNIKLSRIGLVNMAKDVYYLRRVSANGLNEGSTLCGKETNTPLFNYVVTPHAAEMKTLDDVSGKATKEELTEVRGWYNFPLFAEDGGYDKSSWSVYNLGDVVKEGGEMDQWKGTHGGNYHIWRYCTENTIPAGSSATNRENPLQDNLFSTGIVFKGKLLAGQWLGYERKREKTDGTEGTEEVPYMTYNVQRAILASTLGIPFGDDEAMREFDFGTAKTNAATENKHLEDMYLYKPGKGKITWAEIDEKVFSDMTSYPGLYLFEGNLYAGFNEAAEYAYYDGKGGTLYQAMQDVMSHYYLNGADAEKIKVTGVDHEVSGFVQKDKDPGPGYVQLTVDIFAEILGLRSKDQLLEGETYYDRDNYGVRWVDTEKNTATETKNFKEWLTNGNSNFHFTLYDYSNEKDNYGSENSTSQGYGYYCYYFYWNRHNDNGIPGVMAPMEFSVVRNNVYKLSVTKINQIGHPIDPSNDPTPPDPHDDDEKQEVYMKLNVEVVPWTVRVNEIVF